MLQVCNPRMCAGVCCTARKMRRASPPLFQVCTLNWNILKSSVEYSGAFSSDVL